MLEGQRAGRWALQYMYPAGGGKQLGMANSVEELRKKLEALQARMVAAEVEINKLKKKA